MPASPFQQKVKFNRAKFEPVLLKELPEAKARVWTFDWNGDGQPDFGLRIEYSMSNIFREYKLTTRDINKTSQIDFHFVQPDAWKFGYMGNIAPPIKKDDLEFWKSFTETAITLIPVVGEVVLLAEAITGRNIFGDKMSTTERAINGIAALLPIAGGMIAKGFAKEGAELARIAAKLGRSEEEVINLLRAIDKEGAEAEKFARWRDKLKAGGKLTAEEAIEVRSLIQQIDMDVRVSRAEEQNVTRELKKLGIRDDTVKMLEKKPELGRALVENPLAAEVLNLCKSFCIPDFAMPDQVKRLNRLLEDLEKEGVKIDKVTLKEYLHSKKDVLELEEAIDRLVDTFADIKEHRIKVKTGSLIDMTTLAEEEGLTILSREEARLLVGEEKHHPFFRMFLRAFKKANIKSVLTFKGRFRPQRLVDLPTNLHQEILHQLWDDLFQNLARKKGASTDIAKLIESGVITPSQIADRLVDFYKIALKDYPDQLKAVLDSIQKYRGRIGI